MIFDYLGTICSTSVYGWLIGFKRAVQFINDIFPELLSAFNALPEPLQLIYGPLGLTCIADWYLAFMSIGFFLPLCMFPICSGLVFTPTTFLLGIPEVVVEALIGIPVYACCCIGPFNCVAIFMGVPSTCIRLILAVITGTPIFGNLT